MIKKKKFLAYKKYSQFISTSMSLYMCLHTIFHHHRYHKYLSNYNILCVKLHLENIHIKFPCFLQNWII